MRPLPTLAGITLALWVTLAAQAISLTSPVIDGAARIVWRGVSAALGPLLSDVGAFYFYGGQADGLSHPLSSVTAFNRIDTTGYSLAQWQSLFSDAVDSAGNNPVTSLTNEADEVAIQSIVNTTGNYGTGTQFISLPSGRIRLTHPIKSGCWNIQINGAGRNATFLLQTVAQQDGWHHGTPDTACPIAGNRLGDRHFEMKDVSIAAAHMGNRALDIVQSGDSRVILDHVYILGGGYVSGNATTKGAGTFFVNGVRCQSCSNFIATDSYFIGPFGNFAAIAGTGLELTGGATGSMYWKGGDISGYHTCALSYSGTVRRPLPTTENGDNEGLVFDGMQSVGCDDVYSVLYNNAGGTMTVPEYYIKNGQYGTTARHFVNFNGASDVFIEHNLVYTNNPFGIGGGVFSAGSNIVTNFSYLGESSKPPGPPPTAGEVITAPHAVLPTGTTITAVNVRDGTLTLSNPATYAAGTSSAPIGLSFQPTQSFTGTVTAGVPTITGVSGFVTDANGYLIVQKDGCVYGVPGVAGCDPITAVDGYNMTVTVTSPPTFGGTPTMSFHYPEMAPYLYQIKNGVGLWIDKQDVQMPPGDRMGAVLAIANSTDVKLSDWQINDLGNVVTAGFYDQGGNKQLTERGTVFGPNWGATAVYVSNPFVSNTPTVRWGSFYKSLGCDLGSSGKVTCSGSFVGQLSARTDLTVSLPAAFLFAPTVIATNGNYGVSTASCGQRGNASASPSAASFVARCSSGATGSNVRINYIATGY